MALPSGYTPLEYIESTGSQYVDSGIADLIKFVADIQFTSTGARALMGYSTGAGQYFGINANNFLEIGTSTLTVSGTKRNTVTFDVGASTTTLTADGTTISRARTEAIVNTFKIFGGLTSYPCPGKIFSGKIYISNTIARNFLPCTNPSGEVGLYDDVNGVFYGDAAGVGFVAGPVAIYTELEYIESNGTQYIDLNFKPNQDSRLVLDFQVTSENSGLAANDIFGCRTSTSSKAYALQWNTANDVFQHFYNNGYDALDFGDFYVRQTVDMDKNFLTLNGVSHERPYAAFQCDYSLYICCLNNAGTAGFFAKMRVHTCTVYSNVGVIRACIPVQRLDGTVGLLDKVNNVFYPDAAGGNFIPGPLAAQPEAPASLEVIGATRNAAVLAWPVAPVGQSYRLYRDGVMVYEGSALCYTDAGLAAGSSHVYSVHTLSGSTESEGVTTEATTTEGIVLITDRTALDVSAGRRKGYYNALDLIRVGEAMLYAQGLLTQSGYGVSIAPKLDWQLSDIPNHAQMERYLSDIRTLRSAMDLLSSTPKAPGSASGLTWSKANDIEKIIESIEYTVEHVFAGLFRAGQFDAMAGDRRPFPTANSDMGRTWEELDAMETTWANWELATWYLLLYGNLKEEGVVS